MTNKKEIADKELKAVLGKDIGAKNPVFTTDAITELHALFCLYADPRQRRADAREMLMTAGTLGLDAKYELVFRILNDINESSGGNALNFEEFLKEITVRVVRVLLGRAAPSPRMADAATSPSWMCRARASSTSTI